METEITRILIEMILNAECHFCDYKYDCEGCNKLSKFTPNSYIRTAIKEIEKLLQPKEPTYLDVEQYYEDDPETEMIKEVFKDAANQMEQVISKMENTEDEFITEEKTVGYSTTTELSAPLFEFRGIVFNANHIKFVTEIRSKWFGVVINCFGNDNDYTYDYDWTYETEQETEAKRLEFIELWNQNLTRVK